MKNFLLSFVIALCAGAYAADDFAFTYRGRINPSGTTMPHAVDVTFALYAEPAGGEALWSCVVGGVNPSTNGLFQCQLAGDGLADAITTQGARFIGVKIGGGDEQRPRQEILASPLASRVKRANALADGGSVGRIEASQIEAQTVSLAKTTVAGNLSSGDGSAALTFDKVALADGGGNSLTMKAGGRFRVFRDAPPLSRSFGEVGISTVLFTEAENKTGGAVVLKSFYKRDWSYDDGSACITWIVGPGAVKPFFGVGHPVRVYFYPFGTAN